MGRLQAGNGAPSSTSSRHIAPFHDSKHTGVGDSKSGGVTPRSRAGDDQAWWHLRTGSTRILPNPTWASARFRKTPSKGSTGPWLVTSEQRASGLEDKAWYKIRKKKEKYSREDDIWPRLMVANSVTRPDGLCSLHI